MEIRSALQKIENYLTVVSNLNKTILSEGTMSRDELLLMKKYLYTSIDRIEDIERSLIIDKSTDKSFTPTETVENKFIPTKEKEIVAIIEPEQIQKVETVFSLQQESEKVNKVEEIKSDTSTENKEIISEIETPKVVAIPEVENIITEDYSLNKNENENTIVAEKNVEQEIPVVENIITEDYSLNRNENDNTIVAVNVEETIPVVGNIITEDYAANRNENENTIVAAINIEQEIPLVENIITEDYSLNRNEIDNTLVAETTIENKVEPIVEIIPLVENIITEDYSINRNEVKENLVAEKKKEEISFLDKIKAEVANVTETISAKFEVKKTTTFAEELANNKKGETSFFEQLEQKQKATKEAQLFELFNDGKEDLHESFTTNNNNSHYETTKVIGENSTAFEHENENVLVVEKKQVVIETLTPSSLNDVYKPQTFVENISTKSTTTLSESIALNDKFIFVRELFGNQFAEYENALKHIDSLGNYIAAEDYCNAVLWNKFNWTQRASEAGRFMDLMKKKMK